MTKFTCLVALLFIVVQTSFSQEKYSRIKITNPSQQAVNAILSQGIDLSCGANHQGHELIVELSETEINKLNQNNIAFTIVQDDMSK
ncbi:MAG: hypothetical protein HKN40_08620, partial [Winogradskyella sp.]|uniref:hypothetical protein n=1 Tax=Winogradskyella sp. TaxID=1883156 RepID=UPI00181446E0|nr:hypothetical protein [Winogradskyella sp.]